LLEEIKIVLIKLIAPIIEEMPAMWSEKITMSTEILLWYEKSDKGGYRVHPTPLPLKHKALSIISKKEGGNIQNLILFIRG